MTGWASFLQHQEVAWTKKPESQEARTKRKRPLMNVNRTLPDAARPRPGYDRGPQLQVKSPLLTTRDKLDLFQPSKHSPLDLLKLRGCREHTCQISIRISSLEGKGLSKTVVRRQLPSHRAQIPLPTSGRGEECGCCWD